MATTHEITRMTGLASGLDIESLVKAGVANTKNSLDTRKQKLQTLQWKQEAYRNIITAMSDFKKKYLNIESSSSVRANAVMKSNKAVSSDDSLIVAASTSAVAGNYSITSVKTAKAATLSGTKASAGTVELDFSKASEGSNTVTVTLDGSARNITFEGGANAKDNFLTALNESFGKISAAKFSFKDGTNKLTIENAADDKVSHIFTVGYNDAVGLKNDASNMISSTSALGSLDFARELSGDKFEFSINGESFSFDRNTTVKDMMNTINKSDAGVTMSFNALSQSFELKTNQTGAGKELKICQTGGNLLNSLFNLGDELGIAPTAATGLTDKNINDSITSFDFTASETGFASGDSITINGKTLAVTGLTQKQNTEKITVNDSEISAKLYTDADGNQIYRYTQDGSTIYAKKDADDKFETVMTVSAEGVVNVGGSDLEDVTEEDQLSAMGIEKDYKKYTSDEIADALNDAYKASFPDGSGTFSVEVSADTGARITFTPAEDEAVSVEASGSIAVDGASSNYTETAYSGDRVIADTDNLTMTVNGTAVNIAGTGDDGKVTINDLVNSGYFAYDADNGVLSVTGKNTLEFEGESGEAIKKLFGTTTLSGVDNAGDLDIRGSNAQITINGITLESASNSFAVQGTTFSINDVKEFTEDDIRNGNAEEITVNVSKDTSRIKDTIVQFVEAYNELLDKVNDQLNTKRPKSKGEYYDPLTDDQKEEMDTDEIEKWEEQAKTGLLYHDSTLSKVFTQIRQAVGGANVNGMTIQALGIDTSTDYTEYGKLIIKDESALDAAIEKYGDEIANFFTDSKNGLGTVLNNAINAAIDTNTNKNGYAKGTLTAMAGVANTRSDSKNLIYNQITSLQSLIDRLNDRYEKEQERLWNRYSTLESYISTMNNQSSSLFGTSTTG
ncbi:MAG: flagellar filament capping protein FliD [Huintestinicola sp.]|uniref:flagellar filament capping protein FliD n=1 Tax=Huintestinicola sp. TaxID=2981661 RepID=UPI003EFE6E15